jgi:hypothetical protein
MVTKIIFLSLDTAQKPHYCVSKLSTRQRRLATTALLGLAPASPTRATAANRRKSISARRRDDFGVANENVTSKRRTTPVRSIPAPREGGCGEQKSPRKQGAPSASS